MSCFIFKSLSHFEFISVYGVCFNFINLHVAVQLSRHHLLKRLCFLHCVFLLSPLSKIDHRLVGLFLGSQLCSIDLYICFCASTVLF